MFQSFAATSRPDLGPGRLAAFRAELSAAGLDGFLVPRADVHQGEYVAPHDDRLAWLTGFTGSAGFAVILPEIAGVFVDGRYRLQVRAQCDAAAFTPVDWPETQPADWLKAQIAGEARVGFDPWLHTVGEIETLRKGLAGTGIALVEAPTPIDRLWTDQPPPPMAPAFAYPDALAGRSSAEKRADLAAELARAGQAAAVITLPDSLCWLLNIRGGDIPRVPAAHGFAILHSDGSVDLFMAAAKLESVALGPEVRVSDPAGFAAALGRLRGRVRIDRQSAPVAVHAALAAGGADVAFDRDPCVLPKACKAPAELDAARTAHRRDARAVTEFLGWYAGTDPEGLTEIDLVRRLEECRRASNDLRDLSFDTICGAGPNGAIMHYRVTEDTNRRLGAGDLVVLDSGAQYLDGPTDITRALPVGAPGAEERAAYTRVLKGLIAMSRLRFPKGCAGGDLDVLARLALWEVGQDFNHGTGHGVGQYLSVHEGPQRLSRAGREVLKPGMILSNEPGYYRDGAFGIRLENLIVVAVAPPLEGGDPGRDWLCFETLTYVPFERRLIDPGLLGEAERAWIDAYHRETHDRLTGGLSAEAEAWLAAATAPL